MKRRAKSAFISNALLIAIPIVSFSLYIVGYDVAYPYNLLNCGDPDYPYLFNGLGIILLEGVNHVDHPGSPIQILTALFIPIVYLFSDFDKDLARSVVLNPNHYIQYISFAFMLITTTVAVIQSKRLFTLGFNPYTVLLAIILIMANPVAYPNFSVLKAESFLSTAILLFTTQTIILHYKGNKIENNSWNSGTLFSYSFFAALMVSSKIIAAPLLLIGYIPLKSTKDRLKFIGFTILFFFLLLIPALPSINVFFEWIFNLFTQGGRYGNEGELNIMLSIKRSLRKIQYKNKYGLTFQLIPIVTLFILYSFMLFDIFKRWKRVKRAPNSQILFFTSTVISFVILLKDFYLKYLLVIIFSAPFYPILFPNKKSNPAYTNTAFVLLIIVNIYAIKMDYDKRLNLAQSKKEIVEKVKNICKIQDKPFIHFKSEYMASHRIPYRLGRNYSFLGKHPKTKPILDSIQDRHQYHLIEQEDRELPDNYYYVNYRSFKEPNSYQAPKGYDANTIFVNKHYSIRKIRKKTTK